MGFSRSNPSRRYLQLIELNQRLHNEGDKRRNKPAFETFDGRSLAAQTAEIKLMIRATGAKTILDYGCGKAMLYREIIGDKQQRMFGEKGRWSTIKEYWGVDAITLYDPAYSPYTKIPDGPFDGVVCTDVLEHCPESDLDWIVAELFAYSRKFVFATISARPANKLLPNGENAHCTLRPSKFWGDLFTATAHDFPGVDWEIYVGEKGRIVDARFGSIDPVLKVL